ncbi:exodeoxyribonuclease V subunit beta [Hydrogenophilus islandicus]
MTNSFQLYTDPLPCGVHAIEASAGTGKTYTLAQLVVRLVVEMGIPIERILTVTFTRAAAAELRERIFDRFSTVLQVLQGGACEDRELLRWLDSLTHPPHGLSKAVLESRILEARMMLDLATIATIDAFAMEVAREHALTLGLPWNATLLEESERLDRQLGDALWHELKALPEPARESLLAKWSSPDALCNQFRDLGANVLFDEAIGRLPALMARYEELAAPWPAERLQRLFAQLNPWLQDYCRANSLAKCTRMILDPLKRGRFPRLEGDSGIEMYLSSVLKKGAFERIPAEVRTELAQLDELLLSLPSEEVLAFAAFRDAHERWQSARSAALDREGLFTYESLKHRLAEAVSAASPVGEALVAALRKRYAVCLIDEFQDTDPDQWRLFRRLFAESDDHRLFLIGDPKQAIYSFRGANLLTYFAAVRNAHYRHTLTVNYRSHPHLIAAFNALFAEIDGAPTFLHPECCYHEVEAGRDDAPALTVAGDSWTQIRIVTGEGLEDREEATLRQLARDVVWVLTDGVIERKGSDGAVDRRPVAPGEIAVLVKSNSDALAVQRKLRSVGVPSVLTSRTSVWRSDSASDLVCLLYALLHPRRRAEVRAVLAGPFFQYTLAELDDPQREAQIAVQLTEAVERWEREGVLAALLDLFARNESWVKLARLPDGDRRIADTRHLLELLHEEAHQANLSPQALLRWAIAQHQGGSGENQTLRLEKDDDAVEIVTIHSSKGLEYPIVFVYGAWRGVATNRSVPLTVATEAGFLVSFSAERKKERVAQEEQELRRLFYVACTRAVSHLTLYWPNADVDTADYSDALNAILRPRWESLCQSPHFRFVPYCDGEPPVWQPSRPAVVWREPPAVDWGAIRGRSERLTSFTGLVRALPRPDDESVALLDEEGGSEELPAEGISTDPLPAGAAFGTFVHAFLERCDFAAPDWVGLHERWERFAGRAAEESWPRLQEMLAHTLAGNCQPFALQTLSPEQIWREVRFVLRAPRIDTARLNALFHHRPDWAPVEAREVQGYLQGTVDLIAAVDGRYFIVDYKTNRLSDYRPETLTEAMAAHRYTLQALLYTLAIDAHLRRFQEGYDPTRHLGGVRYLFLRGMAAGETSGVYALTFSPEELASARAALGVADE